MASGVTEAHQNRVNSPLIQRIFDSFDSNEIRLLLHTVHATSESEAQMRSLQLGCERYFRSPCTRFDVCILRTHGMDRVIGLPKS